MKCLLRCEGSLTCIAAGRSRARAVACECVRLKPTIHYTHREPNPEPYPSVDKSVIAHTLHERRGAVQSLVYFERHFKESQCCVARVMSSRRSVSGGAGGGSGGGGRDWLPAAAAAAVAVGALALIYKYFFTGDGCRKLNQQQGAPFGCTCGKPRTPPCLLHVKNGE
ncbi:hypothetical protein evm_008764 [Chilo suppressalis]|nr:hypothetical protein evm_008764 [Chilo suppressalis]